MPEAVEIADVAVDTSVDDDDDCGFKVAEEEEEEEDKTQLARITPFNLAIVVPDGPPPDD